MDLLIEVLRFFDFEGGYRSTSEMNGDERFTNIPKAKRTSILRVLSLPGVDLLEKQPWSGRRDAAYRLSRRGLAVIAALKRE